jgi:hypothetical protein
LSRVVRAEPATRLRVRQLTLAALTVVGIGRPGLAPEELRDRLAFLALTLAQVLRSVEQTADAWEKRGYWVKSDRFRAEWGWLPDTLRKLSDLLAEQRLEEALRLAGELNDRLPAPSGSPRSTSGAIWSGAWARWAASGH